MTELSSLHLYSHPLLTALLICHFLSDYQLQSQKIADFKNKDWSFFIKHMYGVAFPLLILMLFNPKFWIIFVIIFLSHALIDFLKPYLIKWFQLSQNLSFLIDQFLHLFVIVIVSHFDIEDAFQLPISTHSLTIILFLVLITKPSNISFKILFGKFQPDQFEKMDTILGAGAMIGILERMIIGICIAIGQFSSIGLVFTAKSIARYNKIAESPSFAEYYLIGSLFSILVVFTSYWICFL